MRHQIIIACLFFGVNTLHAQGVPDPAKQKIDLLFNKIVKQKKDPARVELYKVYSKYFTDNNIYPNADAIDLVDAYNKQSGVEEIKLKKVPLRVLKLPATTHARILQINAQWKLAISMNALLNKSFSAAVETFKQKQQSVNSLENIPGSFKDSLAQFSERVLPGINSYSANIAATQMEFFLVSLRDINTLTGQLANATDNTNTRLAISELMDDFFEYKVSPVKRMMRMRPLVAADNATSLFSFAAYKPEPFEPPAGDTAELPNADIYVYTKGGDGKWSQQPQPNMFNVYYGANGLKYSLTPGCDTLSFFKFHPLVPASTLPVILAKGSYCFILQDVNSSRLFMKPDINLRDNKVIDDAQLIKLCFKVEN